MDGQQFGNSGANPTVALVTGGVTGIGRAVTEALYTKGYHVLVCDFDRVRGEQLEDQLNTVALGDAGKSHHGRVMFVPCDVTSEEQVSQAVQIALGISGRLDVLVNNAGIIRRRTGEEIHVADWDAVFHVNARGPFLFCRAVAPIMKQQNSGRIINISSVAAKLGDITSAPGYGPSKAALDALTRTFAREMAPYGVTVNGVAPHAIETEMSAQWSEEKRKSIIAAIPLGRMGKPEEVAATVLFLVSKGAAFITGTVIDINGGFVMS